ncbi:MAG: hypothetical protein AAGM22_30070 [Acidobacteriota bacterium]
MAPASAQSPRSPSAPGGSKNPSTEVAPSKTRGSGPVTAGQLVAALVGGTLIAVGVGLVTTIFVPGHDGLDEAFLGGLALAGAWPIAMLWVLFAPTTRSAWLRGLAPAIVLLAASAAGLFL